MYFSFVALTLLPLLFASPIADVKRDAGSLIQAQRDGSCLHVIKGKGHIFDNLPVSGGDCTPGDDNVWLFNQGSTIIKLASNPQLVLDAGDNVNNGALKIATYKEGTAAQKWYYTLDKRVAIEGGNQCLDMGDSDIQTYQCTTGNTNQIFNKLDL